MIQIALGTQVRSAVDLALNAGVARTNALASVGPADYIHRTVALVVFAGSVLAVIWVRRKVPKKTIALHWSWIVVALATSQVALGVTMAYVSLKAVIQIAHLTVASLLLGAETVLLLLAKADCILRTAEVASSPRRVVTHQ
jgi:cytochrome c oxidase assembly protein subunit 15